MTELLWENEPEVPRNKSTFMYPIPLDEGIN